MQSIPLFLEAKPRQGETMAGKETKQKPGVKPGPDLRRVTVGLYADQFQFLQGFMMEYRKATGREVTVSDVVRALSGVLEHSKPVHKAVRTVLETTPADPREVRSEGLPAFTARVKSALRK